MRSRYRLSRMRTTRRKFRVWEDREAGCWRWECTMCHPPSYGYRTTNDAWYRIMTVSMPRHFFVRRYHHEHVRRTRGGTVG